MTDTQTTATTDTQTTSSTDTRTNTTTDTKTTATTDTQTTARTDTQTTATTDAIIKQLENELLYDDIDNIANELEAFSTSTSKDAYENTTFYKGIY